MLLLLNFQQEQKYYTVLYCTVAEIKQFNPRTALLFSPTRVELGSKKCPLGAKMPPRISIYLYLLKHSKHNTYSTEHTPEQDL